MRRGRRILFELITIGASVYRGVGEGYDWGVRHR
jgi:hypothetical protein